MAKKLYGTTLWGKEFLSFIQNETDSGRLSRGKTYANTNKIYDVLVNKNIISAKVAGSYSPFYETSLTMNMFPKGDIKVILDFVENNPFILAQIINAKLSKEFLEFFYKNEIELFRGFDMSCNCYDFDGSYACKHITALYFALTNEIDKNPFILLKLRGLDLIKYFDIKKDIKVPYPLELNFTKDLTNNILNNDIQIIKQENYKSFILSLLSSNPPFSHIDYKEVLDEFYKKVIKNLALIISPIRDENIEKVQRILQNSDISFEFKNDIQTTKFKIENELLEDKELISLLHKYKFYFEKEELYIKVKDLFTLFISFEDDFGSFSYKYLFYLFRVAYILIQNCGFIPSVIENKDSLQIIYKPLLCIENINKQINLLDNIVEYIVKKSDKYLDKKSTTTYLLSAIFTDFVPYLDFMHKIQKTNPPKLSYSFFKAKLLKTNNFENKNIAYSIYSYFSIFDIVKSNYSYELHINSFESNYGFSIKVKDKKEDSEYYFKEAIKKYNKIEIIKFLSFLGQFLEKIKELLKSDFVTFTKEELEEFLLKTSTIISNLGVNIILPKELKNLLKPKLSLSIKSSSKSFKSFFTLDKMLEYDWQISIGDDTISVLEFEELLKSGKELLKFKNNFIAISASEAKNMFLQINKKTKLNKFDILQAKLNDEAFLDDDIDNFFEEIFKEKQIVLPKSLNANLRNYQQRGVQWNINNLLNGFGSILADDMGLGKTIQTIASLLYLKENSYIKNKILVVVPTSLLSNWENELEKFAPTLSYFSFYGSKRVMKDTDIMITTYDLLRRDIELFKTLKIDCLIIDEAQKIKNPDTSISKAVKLLKAKYKIALSGTPVENNLSELWSIFDFSFPKYLKTLKDFTNNYAKDIELNKDNDKIEKLKKITAPFMLRRLKTNKDIICDLPDKIIIDEYTRMSKKQISLYKSVVDDTMKQINESNTKGLIFKLIISLKQICNHPRNFDDISDLSIQNSGKTELLITLLENIIIQDEKVLIFTQYTKMADILVEIIQKELLITPLVLKGDMTKKKRDEVVEKFQNDNKYKIFILSLKAGGIGLNLTSANHVIHYDLWFNPAVENQATDRAFRIGQTKKVTVHRLITKNSFEEKIDKMIKSKQALSDLSVNIGENWLKDMDKDELKNIFCGD